MARRLTRNFAILLGIVLLGCLAPKMVQGGNIWQSFGLDFNDPADQFDDQAVSYRERWDPSFLPLRFYLYRDPLTHSVLSEGLYPDYDHGDMFYPEQVRLQLKWALEAWNGGAFSNFQFDPNLQWAEYAPNPRLAGGFGSFYYLKDTAFDGINLITFQDENVPTEAGVVAFSSSFILMDDFDMTEQRQFPVEIIDDATDPDLGLVDFDEDGIFDVLMPIRDYKQGEFLDNDVVFSQSITDFMLWPEDPDDIEGELNDIYGSLDIQGVLTHELGHSHGLGHAQLFEPTMAPTATVDFVPGGPTIGVNPYNQRTPNLDDWIAQALQYPKALPADLGAFSGQVLAGDYLDGIASNVVTGGEPSIPAVYQVPVYLCIPSEQVSTHPDSTEYEYGADGAQVSARTTRVPPFATVAAFADQEGSIPIPFRRIASVPTGIDMKVYPVGYEDDLSGENPDAPQPEVSGDFYMPGIPPGDTYALYVDNPLYTNVNDVMTDLGDDYTFIGEFYGGAHAPGLGTGYVDSNESTGDNVFGNSYIEAGVDMQGRIGIAVPVRSGATGAPLVSGYSLGVERGFAVVKIDNKTFSTLNQAPGPIVSQMVIDDQADRATARWRLEHGQGVLDAPRGITFKNDGRAFVSNGVSNAVMRFNGASGGFEAVFATEGITSPHGLVFDKKGRLYVASEGTNQILRYNGVTGDFIDVFADAGSGLRKPRGIIFDMDGNLLVCSYASDQILRYEGPDSGQPGELIDIFIGDDSSTPGVNEAGGLDGPNDLALDNDGNVQVTSEKTNSIMRFYGPSATIDLQGKPRGFQGLPSDATLFNGNGLSAPHGLLIAANGNGIVASRASNSVIVFNSRTGTFIKNLIAPLQGGLSRPTDIAFGPNDQYLYVCSEGLGRVLQFERNSGTFVKTFATSSGDVIMTFDARLSNAGGVELENSPRAANDVNISYRFQNVSSTAATIELRQTYDLMIMGKENPIYFVNNQQVMETRTWAGGNVPKYIVFQDSLNAPMMKAVVTLKGPGTGGTLPARVMIGRSSALLGSTYNVPNPTTNITDEFGRSINTGLAAYFGPVTIGPGETVDFGLMIGSLLDESRVLKDGPYGTDAPEVRGAAAGTIWEEDIEIAERLTSLPGQVVDGITIITDDADGVPGVTPDYPPAPSALFMPDNGRIPQRQISSQDGTAADIDNDGDLDIVLLLGRASGGQPSFNRLLENRMFPDGDLRFVDVTFGPDGLPGVGQDNLPINNENSMGVAAADFNNDGFVDLFFSNSNGLGVSGVNRLYLNRGDGTFEDVTQLQPLPQTWVMPGVIDLDPLEGADPSMKPSCGDIDSDGDIDIIVPLWGLGLAGENFKSFFQDIRYQIPQTTPPLFNFDGLYFQRVQQDAEPYEVDEGHGETAGAPARILINQLMETGTLHFLDDTLGRDHSYGGYQVIGSPIAPENVDRIPPVMPNFGQPGSTAPPHEVESFLSNVALLGTFLGDASLDLMIGESTFGGSSPATEETGQRRTQPNLRVYNNFDADGDFRPDGYFAQVNWGMDFNLYPLTGGVQQDLTPFFVGIPQEFPDSVGPSPANSNNPDSFQNIRASINGLALADLSYQGIPGPITALTTGDSYYFPRQYQDRIAANFERGAKKGFNGIVTGEANDYFLQGSPFSMDLPTLTDRYFEGVPQTTYPEDSAPLEQLYNPGDEWDIAEETPADTTVVDPGEENNRTMWDVPENIGRWPEETVPTADGWRTRDIAAADFDRDGDIDLFYANDRSGGDGTLSGTTAGPNSYFANNGNHTFTDLSLLALTLETPTQSAGVIQGDYDNDGDVDLYVCNPGAQDHLLRNTIFWGTPDLTKSIDTPLFYDASVEFLPPYWGVNEPPLGYDSMANVTFSSVVADLNCDTRPDLYVGNGGDISAPVGETNFVYFNSGELQSPGIYVMRPHTSPYPAPALFQAQLDVGAPPFSAATATMGVTSADIDNDGDYDLVDVNYQTGPRIYFNEDTSAFTELAAETFFSSMPDADDLGDGIFQFADILPPLDNPTCGIVGVPQVSKVQNSSVAFADLDGDNALDMVVGNASVGSGASNLLLMNDLAGSGMYIDASESERLPRVTFKVNSGGQILDCIQGVADDTRGVALGDFNHDGHVDIFFANSAITDALADARMQPDRRSDGMIGCRLLINHERVPGSGDWGYFVDETEARLPASFLFVERSVQPTAGTVKIGDFDGLGEPSEDVNYNGVLDPGYDLDGDGRLETGEDSFFSYLSDNRGSVVSDNGDLDFIDFNGNGAADLSLDIFIGYEDSPDFMLINDGTGHFIDGSNQLPNSASSIDTRGLPNNPRPTALILNDGSGAFFDASYEIPFPTAVLPGSGDFSLLNDIRDVDFIDFENDGDLDLFVSVAGDTETVQIQGYMNYVLINRMVGANWNAERTTVAQVPGKPIVRVVSPTWANRNTTLTVQVTGANFEPGSTFDFGTGITVVGQPVIIEKTKAAIQLSVSPTAPYGPRTVKVTQPGGLAGSSSLGAFNVIQNSPPPTAVRGNEWMLYEPAVPENTLRPTKAGVITAYE